MDVPPIREVDYIQSFLPTGQNIRDVSVFEVRSADDVLSGKLGVIDLEKACETCDSFMEECPGHSGHLELPVPCFRVFWLKRLVSILNCVCFYCQNLRMPSSDPRYAWIQSLDASQRLENMEHFCHSYKRCGAAATPAPTPCAPSSSYITCCGKLYINFQVENRIDPFVVPVVPLDAQDVEAYQNGTYNPFTVSPETMFNCLQFIPAAVKAALGLTSFNEPEALMWEVLNIPSHNTRPSHVFQGISADKKKANNDWTQLCKHIVTARNELQQAMVNHPEQKINLAVYQLQKVTSRDPGHCFALCHVGKSEKVELKRAFREESKVRKFEAVESAWRKLNKTIAAFHSYKHRNFLKTFYGKPLVGVEERYKGQKDARFRSNIVSRRVNNGLRAVLECSIHLKPSEIGMPVSRALDLTFPECVNTRNARRLHQAILNGPYVYPGANYVLLKNGEEIDLSYYENRRTIDVESVEHVKRHIIDGDVILANRQPTLHRNSQVALRAKIVPHYTTLLHQCLLKGFGGDCDGDELNAHVLQTVEAGVEALELCGVHRNIMKDGKVWVDFIQNAIVGAYLLTRKDAKITKTQMMNMVAHLDLWEYPGTCSGFDIVSLLFPRDFCMNYVKRDDAGKITAELVIINGQMQSGQLTADTLNGTQGVIATMYRDYHDKNIVVDFIYKAYPMFQSYLDAVGMTVGYYDLALTDDHSHSKALNHVHTLAKYVASFPNHDPREGDDDTEKSIRAHIEFVNKAMLDLVTAHHQTRAEPNGLLLSIESGAKGTMNAINSTCGIVGQINVMHKRTSSITSHFQRIGLQACGFISENYSQGVGLIGCLAESHATCESVLHKNKGTAQGGYIVRKLGMCMMGIVVDQKKRVVDTLGRVLWEHYGDDGYDSTSLYILGKIRVPLNFPHVFFRARCIVEFSGCFASDDVRLNLWDRLVSARLTLPSNTALKTYILESLSNESLVRNAICSERLKFVIRDVRAYLMRALIEAGDSVGIRAVQDMGEPVVQMSLKTPHFTGKFRKMSADTVRIAELVDSIYHHPTMCIFLKNKEATREDLVKFGASITRTKLKDIALGFPWFTSGVLTIPIDKFKLFARCVSLRSVAKTIAIKAKIPIGTISTSFANSETQFIQIRGDFTAALIMNFYKNLLIHGLEEIETFVVEEKIVKGRGCITTLGSNLSKILSHPDVDAKKTTCTDCSEVCRVQGIQAARISVEREFLKIMSGVTDDRHIKLIARTMVSGLVLRGMKIKQVGHSIPPLMRAAYEIAPQQMTDYCSLGEKDFGTTICGAALMNCLMRVGTGYALSLETPNFAITPIKMNPYVVSPKVDGTCFALVFAAKRCVALYARNNQVYSLPSLDVHYDDVFFGTVLIGDLVKGGRGEATFYIYDCVLSCGNKIGEARYDLRLEVAREIVYRLATDNLKASFPKSNPIEMHAKKAIPTSHRGETSQYLANILGLRMCVKPIFRFDKSIAKLSWPFPIDGLVFTHVAKPATPFRVCEEACYKWKNVHTVDVRLQPDGDQRFTMLSAEGETFGILYGYGFDPEATYECSWNKQWIVHKKRDKAPNTMETLKATWQAIQEGVAVDQVFP